MNKQRSVLALAGTVCAALSMLVLPCAAAGLSSQCYGTVARGRIENAVQLPAEGRNFHAYSRLGPMLGRTYLHSRVLEVVLASYAALEKTAPNKTFVYGETGLAHGGRFRPHRTHQNGLSVDFMVPVLDASEHSVPLPANVLNEFGYNVRFDAQGRYRDYRIDFEAVAEHLYQLHVAAVARGVGIGLVIFEPEYQSRLFATRRGQFLRSLPWMKKTAWIRHDNHYHVDFMVPCLPLR